VIESEKVVTVAPTASTTCSASALAVLSLPEAIASWLFE